MEKRVPLSLEEMAAVQVAILRMGSELMNSIQELEEYIKANPGSQEDQEQLDSWNARWLMLAGIVEKVKV